MGHGRPAGRSRSCCVGEAEAAGQDEAFPAFVAAAREAGAAVEVVSDGLGFYVAPNLARLGLADLPVATNENRLRDGGRGLSFPNGHPACFVCGTCKRERVLAHQAAGRAVVFIGDGDSDRYAAGYADVVFAKGALAGFCPAAGWPFRALDRLRRDDRLARGRHRRRLAAGERRRRARLAGAPIPRWPARADRPFICGPEVWGPGRDHRRPASRSRRGRPPAEGPSGLPRPPAFR